MIDFHCHLDLYKDPMSLLKRVHDQCSFVLAVTTSPRAWQITSQKFCGIDCIHTAIGLHPEIVEQKKNEINQLLENIKNNSYIGEVGIDGSPKYRQSLILQREVFEQVIEESENCNGKIMSIHSRFAVNDVLRILENHIKKSSPVLHWFMGSIKELQWSNSLGCWYSINPVMFSTARGRNLIIHMPLDRILPETDAPFAMNGIKPYMPWDTSIVIRELSKLHNIELKVMEQNIQNNLYNLNLRITE